MIVAGSGTTRTVRGTTVPTLMSKFTLVTRGAELVSTVWRILVFCSVVNETLPPAPPPERSAVPCLLPPVDGDWDCWVVEGCPFFCCDCWVVEGWPLLSCDCCVVDGCPLLSCDCRVVDGLL